MSYLDPRQLQYNNSQYNNGLASYYTAPSINTQQAPVRARIPAPTDVEDALQYTPLSSVVPFGGNLIPLPSIYTSGSSALKTDRQPLQWLERQAQVDPGSEFVQRAAQEVSGFILTAAKNGPIFEFKQPPHFKAHSTSNAATQVNINELRISSRLLPFESTVLANCDVSPRYDPQQFSTSTNTFITTTVSDHYLANAPYNMTPAHYPNGSRETPALQMNGMYPQATQFNNYPQSALKSNHSYTSNEAQLYSPSGRPLAPTVVLPPSIPEFDPTQYQVYTEVDAHVLKAKTNLKKRKKPSMDDDDDSETLMSSVDARQKAQAAVNNLKTLFGDIFEAEDNIQPDTSEKSVSKSSSFWAYATVGAPCLSTGVQVKLETAIQKVVQAGKFGDIELDDLVRLEKLCENTLRLAEVVEIRVTDDLDSADTSVWDDWATRIGNIDNSLKTSKTILRMLNGGRTEKQLYSEDMLQCIVNVCKNLFESSLNVMIELRPKTPAFKVALAQKKILLGILHELTIVFRLLSQLLAAEEVKEDFVTKIEYLSIAMIFIDNANTEKESVFGIQKVEQLRVAAMDVLSTIFARYKNQQQFIIDEILSNLAKLPSTRQSARNFKLPDGGNIQLTSALILTLLQTAGTYRKERPKRSVPNVDDDGASENGKFDAETPSQVEGSNDTAEVVDKLEAIVKPLNETTLSRAHYISSFLISRAMTSTKSGDSPYRNLLDIFIEDFLLVLTKPDWPGAELILRMMVRNLSAIADDPKSAVPAKGMALELLGLMGAGICDLMVHVREVHRGYNQQEGDVHDKMISSFAEDFLQQSKGVQSDNRAFDQGRDPVGNKMMLWNGPFKLVLEQLWDKAEASDGSLRSAFGYYATIWGSRLITTYRAYEEDGEGDEKLDDITETMAMLTKISTEKTWYDMADSDRYMKNPPSPLQLRHAYELTIMLTSFCTAYEGIFTRLSASIYSDQTTTRNKGLKAITQLITKDPTLLERPRIIESMQKRSMDQSPQVRDSALDMLGKCLVHKPGLEEIILPAIIARAMDATAPIRKRAMKILKDVYLRSTEQKTRLEVAESLLQRITDHDDSVAELAMRTFEEVWISPFYPMLKEHSDDEREMNPKAKLVVKERVRIIVSVAQAKGMDDTLINLIKTILGPENKQLAANTKVCMWMVQSLFDDLLEHVADNDKIEKQGIFKTLNVFAKANPGLFKIEQLELLQPYIQNLQAQDDLTVYRNVIIIFRCVLPSLSSASTTFLADVAKALLMSLASLPNKELREAVFCLATINVVHDISPKLIAVTSSCFIGLNAVRNQDTNALDLQTRGRTSRLLYLLGVMGQYCNFEKPEHHEIFRKRLEKPGIRWKGPIAQLIVETILQFCGSKTEMSIRKSALESLCYVCKRHPAQFIREDLVPQTFEAVFEGSDADLQQVVLRGMLDFFQGEEKLSDEALANNKSVATTKEAVAQGDYDPGRLTGASTYSSQEGVSAALSQKFLGHILKIALSSYDDKALTAVEVVGSILRQGSVHPSQPTPALIALETSPNPKIESIAFREHKSLTNKHETIVERSYMDGVRAAFAYQREVVGSTYGADETSFASKLASLYHLVQTNRKLRKKLLGNLMKSIDFEPLQLNMNTNPTHLVYARFILQNLAFFEYSSMEDVVQVTQGLDRVVAGTGTTVAHQIEVDLLQIGVEAAERVPVDIRLKRKFCGAAVILMMTWGVRTYLRKLYGLGDPRRKHNAKDILKAPTKVQGVHPRSLWEEMSVMYASLDDEGSMDEQCRQFVEVLTVDKDFKLAAENEEDELGFEDGDDDGLDDDRHSALPAKKRRKTGTPPIANKRKRKSGSLKMDEGDSDVE